MSFWDILNCDNSSSYDELDITVGDYVCYKDYYRKEKYGIGQIIWIKNDTLKIKFNYDEITCSYRKFKNEFDVYYDSLPPVLIKKNTHAKIHTSSRFGIDDHVYLVNEDGRKNFKCPIGIVRSIEHGQIIVEFDETIYVHCEEDELNKCSSPFMFENNEEVMFKNPFEYRLTLLIEDELHGSVVSNKLRICSIYHDDTCMIEYSAIQETGKIRMINMVCSIYELAPYNWKEEKSWKCVKDSFGRLLFVSHKKENLLNERIKTGDLIELRNSQKFIVLKDTSIGSYFISIEQRQQFYDILAYKADATHVDDKNLDIMAIYKPNKSSSLCNKDLNSYTLSWKRYEPVEVSLKKITDMIAKEFGCDSANIKIIG